MQENQNQNNTEENQPLVAKGIVPGLVTGASDNDPAGIATYSLSGIRFGYGQLWLLVLTTPMLIALQSMVARIAIVTKKGLATNFKNVYSRNVAFGAVALLVVANVLTIGANIAAMSEAAALLVPGTSLINWVVPVSFIMWYVVVFLNYKHITQYFLWLILFYLAFIFSAILAKPDWGEIFVSIVKPAISLNKEFLLASVALIGTTIAPYLFFWEPREVIEDKTPVRLAKWQNWLQAPGFILSNFVAFMIIVATGTLLFGNIEGEVTAVQVAQALEPVAGEYAKLLFAIGILGAGFLAVPVLASSSAFGITELLGWREGLSQKFNKAIGFYGLISVSILVGIQIAISGFDPLKALFLSQVIAGLLAPPLIFLILLLANNKKVMGKYTNGWFENIFGVLALLALLASGLGLILLF
ncbi:MAG: hypothetical protein A3J48_02200 [Candidatus Doudnabacteria bacterium RIFCSPHIGHO2_02_FULL_46_11]|uniref:Iron transporter n=1 Tax=Candidatus Doudnabacteria bacterium RIFCSPHIGHO2_02_FULL_46_11 TaxID=1817832 RepID=A0A1F5P4X8_9BACT|nr:MAG: hypothetical protein A3J48_02200 [Candidatus Doudnabacteria bacterium RIFCSPHIGHO2_02_FULL_46_11]